MDWEPRLRDLEMRLLRAQKRVEETSARLAEVTADIPSGIPHPDGVVRIRTASKEYLSALSEFEDASRELTDFLRLGEVPGDSSKPN